MEDEDKQWIDDFLSSIKFCAVQTLRSKYEILANYSDDEIWKGNL